MEVNENITLIYNFRMYLKMFMGFLIHVAGEQDDSL